MPLRLVLRRQRQASGIEASLLCIASSRPDYTVCCLRKGERRKKLDGAGIGKEVERCSS